LEERLDLGCAAVEIAEQQLWILAAAAREHLRAQEIAVRTRQSAVRVEPFTGVARQHLAPQISVVAGRVARFENVSEVRRVASRRNRGIVESARLERVLLERRHLLGTRCLRDADLVPGLIEQGRREVLGGGIALVEFLRRQHLGEQLGRHRRPGLVVAGVWWTAPRAAAPRPARHCWGGARALPDGR